MSDDSASPDDYEEAARWSDRLLDSQSPETHAAFEAWLAGAPGRIEAFKKIQRAREFAQALADTPELRAIRHDAMKRIAARRSWRAAFGRPAAALAAACVLLIGGGFALWQASIDVPRLNEAARAIVARAPDGGRLYETAVGQRLVVTLEDSSVLTLDTASRASVSFGDGQRSVRLYAGQAFFKVAHDAARPFVVTAGDTRVVALGTEFDVRLVGEQLAVTLVTGRVRVERASAEATTKPRQLAVLDPGEQFVAALAEPVRLAAADVQRVTAWRRGQLIFEDQTLSNAVAEMNRYTRRQIVIRHPELAQLPISGAFETGQSETFIEALTSYFPIEVVAVGQEQVVLDWRGAPAGQ